MPETEGLPFGDEEFDCMTLEEWLEQLSETLYTCTCACSIELC